MKWNHDTRRQPHENTYLKLDSSKSRTLLGWLPRLDLKTTLEWVVDWTRKFEEKADMRAFTARQIDRFARLVKKVAAGVASCAALEELADLFVISCGVY